MFTFLKNLKAMTSDKRGVTAMEYAMIAGLVAAVLVGAVGTFTAKLTSVFTAISTAM